MRKILTPQEMSAAEAVAYSQGFSESLFMDYAGIGVAEITHHYMEMHRCPKQITLLCGKGNNAGDAYVAGCKLIEMGYEVSAIQVGDIAEATPLCRKNWEAFHQGSGGIAVDATSFPQTGVIIDGLFGTGFHGEVTGIYADLIRAANASGLPIIAVDIPSGLNGATGQVGGVAINATITAFLGQPKRGFFLCDGWNHVGLLHHVDFGLPAEYIERENKEKVSGFLLAEEDIKPLLPKIVRNRHKYEAGYVISLAGSPHMPGAAILASMSALKAGAGIVRLFYPEGMEAELAAAPFELIKQPYTPEHLEPFWNEVERAKAILIGPGCGATPSMANLLGKVMPRLNIPCVIDADALTLYAQNPYPLPPHTVLTPHKGEMLRLLHESKTCIDEVFLEKCQKFADENKVTVVVKGAPTFIFHPEASYLVSPAGNPGMATAGSGDVLTGIIAAFLAQGVKTQEAAALGVYLHGFAGEMAALQYTPYSMTATDIISCLPKAFRLMLP